MIHIVYVMHQFGGDRTNLEKALQSAVSAAREAVSK